MSPPAVLLVGMMGAGKSTVGRALSAATGWRYVDNDVLVAEATGLHVRELLEARGEAALREAESGALTVALALAPPVIAGVAAGVVLDASDRERLRNGGFVVYLRAQVATLVHRVSLQPPRPWLADDPAGAILKLYDARETHLEEVASLVVDVDDATPEQIVASILASLPGSAT